MTVLEIWATQQARYLIDMVQYPLADKAALLDLVRDRVLVIETHGALREANESRMSRRSPSTTHDWDVMKPVGPDDHGPASDW